MAGRHVVCAEPAGAVEERGELHVAVAVRTRQRRPSCGVLAHEVRDDGLLKLLFEVDDVVREADRAGYTSRVAQIVERAAPAEGLAVLSARRLRTERRVE